MTIIRRPPSELAREEQRLLDRAKVLVDQGTPENTKRAYAGDWARFLRWCESMQRVAIPASHETVILYLTHLADPGRVPEDGQHRGGVCKPSTIDRALSAIAFVHKVHGLQSPRRFELVKQHLSRTKKALKAPTDRAAPLLPVHLSKLVGRMSATNARSIRDRSILTLGWSAALRRSEIAALDREDIVFCPEGAIITIRSSKTDQEGAGETIPIEPAQDPNLCPIAALRAWVAFTEASSGPLFWRTFHRRLLTGVRMHGWEIDRLIKHWCKVADVTPEDPAGTFSAHSLRAGFITAAARAGKPEWRIMEHTRHRSYDVFRSYIRIANVFMDNPQRGLL